MDDLRSAFSPGHPPARIRLIAHVRTLEEVGRVYDVVRLLHGTVISSLLDHERFSITFALAPENLQTFLACRFELEVDESATAI